MAETIDKRVPAATELPAADRTVDRGHDGPAVPEKDAPQLELADAQEACRILGGNRPINQATLYRGIKRGFYPKPIKIGPNTNRWVVPELRAVVAARLAARDEGRATGLVPSTATVGAPEMRRRAAYHEAGHAVIARLLKLSCGHVTIIPEEPTEVGHVVFDDPMVGWTRGDGRKKSLADAFCIALFAGAEAEKRMFGTAEVGDNSDCAKATACLHHVSIPGATYVGDHSWERYETRLRARARNLIEVQQDAIEAVAQALLDKGFLRSHEVDDLLMALGRTATQEPGRAA
jgi:predicted DNA-binding transcriptional regulator AlpA